MPHIFVSLNFWPDCKILIPAQPIELYRKHWFSLLSPSVTKKTSYFEEIYKSK